MKMLILSIIALVCAGCAVAGAKRPPPAEPSGAPYDWKATRAPERPYLLSYDQSLVMKLFLAEKANGGQACKVHLTFEQALEVIRRLDIITCGAPKIIYLVGWQYNGHDSKYPAWSEVNARLKRPQDKTALDSLNWLMREARQYHTIVSLHINMFDAYADSPLWPEYLAKDVIAKDKQGKPLAGETFDGQSSYQISYAREWETGLARQRIDGLLAMLPELKKAKTLHIDAFHSRAPVRRNESTISPYLGYSIEKETAAQRQIFRYFRDQGIDITSEGATFLRIDWFVGLQPMAWVHDWPDNAGIPQRLLCSTPMRAEQEIKKDPKGLAGLQEIFCTRAAPWLWSNDLAHADDSKAPQAVDWARVKQGEDVCYPLPWTPKKSLIAYSKAGCATRTWQLPPDWRKVTQAKLKKIAPDGSAVTAAGTAELQDGKLTLSLQPGEAMLIEAK
jgi:hypothetical protein